MKTYCCFGAYYDVGCLDDCRTKREPKPAAPKWKLGDEFAPFHPDASHVPPDYRDGWNACYRAAASLAPKE